MVVFVFCNAIWPACTICQVTFFYFLGIGPTPTFFCDVNSRIKFFVYFRYKYFQNDCRYPKAAHPDSWEHDLDQIKQCCLWSEEDQTPELINRLAVKRLRFCKLQRVQQSEVILELMRSNRNVKVLGGLKSALVCQFEFCRACVRRIYGLTSHRWKVYWGIHLANPNQRRLLRADIAADRDGLKEGFFIKYLQDAQVHEKQKSFSAFISYMCKKLYIIYLICTRQKC